MKTTLRTEIDLIKKRTKLSFILVAISNRKEAKAKIPNQIRNEKRPTKIISDKPDSSAFTASSCAGKKIKSKASNFR